MLPRDKRWLFDAPYRLVARPEPIAGNLRLSWSVALIILLTGYSRGKRTSIPRLHLLAHAAQSAEGRLQMRQYLAGRTREQEPIVRVEPWLNRAASIASAQAILTLSKGRTIALTSTGKLLFDQILGDDSILQEEQQFAQFCARNLTEGDVKVLMRTET